MPNAECGARDAEGRGKGGGMADLRWQKVDVRGEGERGSWGGDRLEAKASGGPKATQRDWAA